MRMHGGAHASVCKRLPRIAGYQYVVLAAAAFGVFMVGIPVLCLSVVHRARVRHAAADGVVVE
jgi:hypothetical protein